MTHHLPENSLYHYCSLKTGLEKILPQKQLLLSSYIKTNDPRENKELLYNGYLTGEGLSELMNTKGAEINEILRNDCKLICLSKCNFNKGLFGFEYSPMWAHYGDNHKGFCIELDRNAFLEENGSFINKAMLRDVQYCDLFSEKYNKNRTIDYTHFITGNYKNYLRNEFRKQHLDYLYFTKLQEWEYENEVRLLHFSENKDNEYCSIKSSIKRIYLGVDFNHVYIPTLFNLSKNFEVVQLRFSGTRIVEDRQAFKIR